jgi:glycosyltransferase involved in cell wall biosynthesis
MKNNQLIFYVVANMAGCGNPQPGLSGGDKILIELIKSWLLQGHKVNIFTSESGHLMFRRYLNENEVNYLKTSKMLLRKRDVINLFLFVLVSFIKGCIASIKVKINKSQNIIIYSASDFWPDSIPACIMKLKNKNAILIAGFYLFPPNPFRESVYHGKRFVYGLIYYLSQKPIYSLIKIFSDMAFVTNKLDRSYFIGNKKFTEDRVIAIKGGVDTKILSMVKEPEHKEFDAIFIGRLTAWKGVLKLIETWKYVCERRANAKLAIVGSGELMEEVIAKIKTLGLERNVFTFGFKDGIDKIKLIKSSKVVVHPSIYDSGGMAASEAMACGLPGVSFDLESLRSYYPKGLLKTPQHDIRKFAENILNLLEDEELYKKVSKEALELAKQWGWEGRTKKASAAIMKLVSSKT